MFLVRRSRVLSQSIAVVICLKVLITCVESSAIIHYQEYAAEKNQCNSTEYYDSHAKECRKFYGGGRVLLVDNTARCANNQTGVIPYADTDKLYYICQHDSVVIAECTGDLRFSEETSQCERRLPCNIRQMPKCTTAGRFPVAENCSCFYTCDQVDGKLTTKLHKCPGTSLYSPATKKCSYRCNVTPTEVINKNVTVIEANCFPSCTKPGRFRTPTDCSKYYTCSAKTNGRFYQTRYKCPSGFLYDIKKELCMPADEVKCKMMTATELLNLYEYYRLQKKVGCKKSSQNDTDGNAADNDEDASIENFCDRVRNKEGKPSKSPSQDDPEVGSPLTTTTSKTTENTSTAQFSDDSEDVTRSTAPPPTRTTSKSSETTTRVRTSTTTEKNDYGMSTTKRFRSSTTTESAQPTEEYVDNDPQLQSTASETTPPARTTTEKTEPSEYESYNSTPKRRTTTEKNPSTTMLTESSSEEEPTTHAETDEDEEIDSTTITHAKSTTPTAYDFTTRGKPKSSTTTEKIEPTETTRNYDTTTKKRPIVRTTTESNPLTEEPNDPEVGAEHMTSTEYGDNGDETTTMGRPRKQSTTERQSVYDNYDTTPTKRPKASSTTEATTKRHTKFATTTEADLEVEQEQDEDGSRTEETPEGTWKEAVTTTTEDPNERETEPIVSTKPTTEIYPHSTDRKLDTSTEVQQRKKPSTTIAPRSTVKTTTSESEINDVESDSDSVITSTTTERMKTPHTTRSTTARPKTTMLESTADDSEEQFAEDEMVGLRHSTSTEKENGNFEKLESASQTKHEKPHEDSVPDNYSSEISDSNQSTDRVNLPMDHDESEESSTALALPETTIGKMEDVHINNPVAARMVDMKTDGKRLELLLKKSMTLSVIVPPNPNCPDQQPNC